MRLLGLFCAAAVLSASDSYVASVQQWRQERESALKSDTGWLTVTGLFWLHEGRNTFGTDPGNDIVLAEGPARTGYFELRAGRVTDHTGREMIPDTAGEPTKLQLGNLTLYVIHRGQRYAIRVKDKNSKFRREFTDLRWFPVRQEYRVIARFVASPSKIPIPNVLGETEKMTSPGYVTFRLHGRELKLYPVLETPGAKSLFFIFRDLTSAKETYGAGRFLYTDAPKDGTVTLDFNKAYNPPCAFTPYATCPLPPKQNRLPVRIEAGELRYGEH